VVRRRAFVGCVGCVAAVLALGCASEPAELITDDDLVGVTTTTGTGAPIAPATECTITRGDARARPGTHVATCSDVAYGTRPPSIGPHYGTWADFRAYDAPVPWGFVVHSLEHGAVVLAYDCPSGCPELVASLRAFVDAYPGDARCSGTGARARFIVMPARDLGAPVAAAAWGKIYRATCFDETSLRAFVDETYARSPEDLCAPGVDLSGGWC